MDTIPLEKNATHVLIIGAGVTGLAIAHGLQKAGIKCSVYEYEHSASTYRPREWTMGIHWALPLLESLLPDDMAVRLNEAYVDPFLDWNQSPCDKMRMYNGLTGEIMKDVPIRGKIVRVSRRKLRAFLAEGVDVQYGHEFVDIKYDEDGTGVTAVFANGVQERGSLIVGTDGPKSCVRRLIFGDKNVETTPLDPVVHTNLTYCPGDAGKARLLRSTHPAWSIVLHPELWSMISIQNVPDAEKPETWNFQVASGWIAQRDDFSTASSRMVELKRKGALLPEPFKSAIEWIPDDFPITFDMINYWESQPWDVKNGRVTLAGDAAHPMPPHRGQGLNHALQDAHNLVTLLVSHAQRNVPQHVQAAALQANANEVAIRGAEEVNLSKQNAFMVLNWGQLEQSPVFKHALDRSPVVEKTVERKDSKGMEVETEEVKHALREVGALRGV